jgi:hypothetical protein
MFTGDADVENPDDEDPSKAAGGHRRQLLFVAMGALRTAGPRPDPRHVSQIP